MKVLAIGRTEILYESIIKIKAEGHDIVGIVTAKPAPEYKKKEKDFENLAKELNVPFFSGVNLVEIESAVKQIAADIAVSVNFPLVISQNFIDLSRFGILNAHGGDLPNYRGNACQAWAILNGEKKIGLCVHKMIGGKLDHGGILSRKYLDISESTKITEVMNWIQSTTPNLFFEAIANLEADSEFCLPQNLEAVGSRCYPRKPEDGKIDWGSSALLINRLINASNKPYSGAFCYFEGKKVTIWDAEVEVDGEVFFGIPGQITKIEENDVVVACGEGKIRIKQVEIDSVETAPSYITSSQRLRLT